MGDDRFPFQLLSFSDELRKIASEKQAKVITPLQHHQQRVVDRIQRDDQPGLVVVHGLGSGKTLTSIAAADALNRDTDVVVPASLQENYKKEIAKHVKGRHPKTRVVSMQNMATRGESPKAPLMVVDEAHRGRDHQTATFQALKKNEAEKRLLLTASPFYNHPADIAPLIDLAANQKVLPFDRDEFSRRYITEKVVKPPVMDRIANHFRKEENQVKPGTVPMLYQKNAPELQAAFHKWVDYHPGSTDEFPEVRRHDVDVPMSKEQLKVYDTLMDKAPAWVAQKVKRGLPPSKKESQQLNAFLSAARQAANTTAPFSQNGEAHDPKIQQAYENLKKTLDENPRAKAVVYSNYLEAGIDPYKRRLDEAKIPYGEFTGQMTKKKRDQLVRDYNDGKLRALLLSSAGGEGLDLKGTRLMQVLEPHWNREKLKQVEGRGARYKSHSHLAPEERNLLVENYRATRPEKAPTRIVNRVLGRAPDKSVDEYLSQMSDDKEKLIEQFRDLLPKAPKVKTSAKRGSTRSETTPESKDLANSLKPRAAAFAAYTLPTAAMGAGLGSLAGREGAIAGGALGAIGGQAIANIMTRELVRSGKAEAKKALQVASKENALRENAHKLDWGEIGSSALWHIGTSAWPTTTAVLRGDKIGLGVAGASVVANAIGALGAGYLDKYKRMIAVNELDNVRAHEAIRDAQKLQRMRRQISDLEARVEGDGWNAPEKATEERPVLKKGPKTYDW